MMQHTGINPPRRLRGAALLVASLMPAVLLSACSSDPSSAPTPRAVSTGEPTSATPTSPTAPSGSTDVGATTAEQAVVGTVLQFRSDRATVDVTVRQDNPTVRDLLRRLPLRLAAAEFAGREKLVDIPGGLTTRDSAGSDPENGDLIYFTPWENLGFYYNAAGIGFSDQTIHIGTYNATREQLDRLEGTVTISRID